jgi:hypothetical protein
MAASWGAIRPRARRVGRPLTSDPIRQSYRSRLLIIIKGLDADWAGWQAVSTKPEVGRREVGRVGGGHDLQHFIAGLKPPAEGSQADVGHHPVGWRSSTPPRAERLWVSSVRM